MLLMRRAQLARVLPVLAVALVTGYGALLRLDALVEKYGSVERPRVAAFLTRTAAPLGERLRPYNAGWPPETNPYVGGDPINYLRFAREMEHFYQGHVREPVFLALTRGFLWLLDDQDIGLSFASAAGSVLAIVGAYLLGAALMPRAAALAAALLVAVEFELITWSVDGWRDDTFMAAVLFAAWAFLRVRQAPTTVNALVLGLCGGAACLTRITSLSFLLPALVVLAVDEGPPPRRERLRALAIAAAMMTLVVAPYLISCAVSTGDPLIAINYHTVYYRHGEGLPTDQAMSATDYIAAKFAESPVAAFDTGFLGIFIEPFITKWRGLPPVLGSIRELLVWSAPAGLFLMAFTPAGRLLLALLFASLLPYAWTWNIGGGNAWRFTMHAYPIYMVAAFYAVTCVVAGAKTLVTAPGELLNKPTRGRAAWALAVCILAALVPAVYRFMPWLVIREAVRRGEDVNIETGPRDRLFYRSGWSPPHDDGVIVRVSQAERVRVHLPLTAGTAYELALRIDPVAPEAQRAVSVLFNGQLVARLDLTWDPERFGSYRLRIQPHQVRAGRNELTLVPDMLVPATRAGPRFSWLPDNQQIGLRLWYVRVLPNPQ
jgi:hypothetical protein